MLVLPPYSVRISARAKRLHLKVMPPGKVEVVVPKRFNLGQVPAFVAEHGQWLRQHLERMAAEYMAEPLLPDQIELRAVEEIWRVDYVSAGRSRVNQTGERHLQVRAPDEHLACAALQRWLQQRACVLLPGILASVSDELGLPFEKVTVRAQRSRWGSCSSRKHISLNRAALFISPSALRYLLIHELCHTLHMNHSPRYWRLVERFMPEYKLMEAELRQAMKVIPRWALPG